MDFLNTFTEDQKGIYEVAKTYLQKNPHFTIDELFSVCKKKTKVPDNKVMAILEEFVWNKIFVPGSRLTRETVLNNEKRDELFQLISKNPGLNFNQIIKRSKLGSYMGSWHLELLKKFEIIKERKFMIYNLYFPQNFPEDKEITIFFLRNPNILKIYVCLKYSPLNPNILSKILDLHYSTIQYHLRNLQKHEIILNNEDNCYSINPKHVNFLAKYYDLNIPDGFKTRIERYLKKKKSNSIQEREIEVLRF